MMTDNFAGKITTPIGTLKWVNINEPREGKTSAGKKFANWCASLYLNEADTKAFKKKLEDLNSEAFTFQQNNNKEGQLKKRAMGTNINLMTDSDGVEYFYFKRDAKYDAPEVVDKDVKRMGDAEIAVIGNGSTGRIVVGYGSTTDNNGVAGARFYFNILQIANLKEYVASLGGLDAIDGDYEAVGSIESTEESTEEDDFLAQGAVALG